MAAKIRLKRVGRKGQPSYRIVVLDGQKPRDAKVVADLGTYDPKTNPPTFEVDSDAALKWLLDGAKATSAARSILSKAGVMAAWDAAKRGETVAMQPKELKPTTKRKKKEEPVAEEAPETVDETPDEPTEQPEGQADDQVEETQETAEPEAEAPEEPAEEPTDDAAEEEAEVDEEAEPEEAPAEEPEADAPEESEDDTDEEEAKEEA